MDSLINGKVAAIVVTYNRKDMLRECLDALLQQEYANCIIIVVDNASTDGTRESIDDYIQSGKICYKNTGENLGGAGGFNYGMKAAYEIGCDFMWLMDDDCIVQKDSLSKLIAASNDIKDYGFLSSKVLWKDGDVCKMNIQKSSIKNKITDWETDRQRIIMATFVSFFVKTKVVKEVGLPIKEFFIWADDIEFSRRISRKYDCYLITSSVVHHKSKNNIGSDIAKDNSENLGRYSYAYRNEAYIYKREGLYGKLYYKLKVLLHKRRVKKSDDSNETKNIKLNIINTAVETGRSFNPPVEML